MFLSRPAIGSIFALWIVAAGHSAADATCKPFASYVDEAPVVAGRLGSVGVDVDMHESGGNGAVFSATMLWLSFEGGMRVRETHLDVSVLQGDRMRVFFAGMYVYFENWVYLHGEGHCCAQTFQVQRFRMRSNADGRNTIVRSGVVYVARVKTNEADIKCPRGELDDDVSNIAKQDRADIAAFAR